jgi:hypothetical protein
MSAAKQVFVSYSTSDRYRAAHIVKGLRDAGFLAFWDQDLLPRQNFRAVLANKIRRADRTIVLWSRASIESRFVADEANLAREIGTYTPVMLDKVQPPLGLRGEQFLWLYQWDGDTGSIAWEVLLKAVQGDVTMDGALLPLDAFSDLPSGPTMVPIEITTHQSSGLTKRRLSVGTDFITCDQFRQWAGAVTLNNAPAGFDHPWHMYAAASYIEAKAFCAWLSSSTGRNYRLLQNADFDAIACALGPFRSGDRTIVAPRENLQSLRSFTRTMWTWVEGVRLHRVDARLTEVAEARGGCWLTPHAEEMPRAMFTTTCRLPFVALRVAADI